MKHKVLVIDDDKSILDLIAHKLRHSFEFISATSGNAAVELLRKEKVSLILMDQVMPEIDGMETVHLVKGVMESPPPIIMMTAYGSSELLLAFMKSGGADFVAKPLDFDILEIKMHRAIEAAQAAVERRMMEKTLARQERLASLGILSEGISHEILNPLNVISAIVQVMQLGLEKEKYQENLKNIMGQVGRIVEIIKSMRTYARPHNPQEVAVDIHGALDRVILNMALIVAPGIIVKDYDNAKLTVSGNEEEIGQVFKQVVQNAVEAIRDREGGVITVATRLEGNKVMVAVADNGRGIKAEDVEKIFDPFFTTKDVGEGMGLGLSVACSIMRFHGGSIHVESKEGGGTKFTIAFPAAR